MKFIRSNKVKICFILLIYMLAVFLYLNIINNTAFVYDASGYWGRSKLFWRGGFQWENYNLNLRGYVFPFILGVTRELGSKLFGNQYVIYRLLYSVCSVSLLCVLVPKLVGIKLGTIRWCVGSFITLALFLYFWIDLLKYPLSDVIGLFFYSLFLVFTKIIILEIQTLDFKRLSFKKKVCHIIAALIYGGGVYATYNIRTVYLIPILLVIIYAIIQILLKKRFINCILLLGFIIGGIVVAYPQMLINYKNLQAGYTPFVVTQYSGKENNIISQLEDGIAITKFNVYNMRANENTDDYPEGAVYYYNTTGLKLMEGKTIDSFGEYFLFVLSHPIEILGIYMEHFFSGITMFYNSVYINDMHINWIPMLANFFLYTLALVGLIYTKHKTSNSQLIDILFFIMPAILALPGAVEERYFLPIYLLIYIFITMVIDYYNIIKMAARKSIFTCVILFLFSGIWSMVACNIANEPEYAILGFDGSIAYKGKYVSCVPLNSKEQNGALSAIKAHYYGRDGDETILYKTHSKQNKWGDWKKEGEYSGAKDGSFILDGIQIKMSEQSNLQIQYRALLNNREYTEWVSNAQICGDIKGDNYIIDIEVQIKDE